MSVALCLSSDEIVKLIVPVWFVDFHKDFLFISKRAYCIVNIRTS